MNSQLLKPTFFIVGFLILALAGGQWFYASGPIDSKTFSFATAEIVKVTSLDGQKADIDLLEQMKSMNSETNRRLGELVGKVAALESQDLDEIRNSQNRLIDGVSAADLDDEEQQLHTQAERQTQLLDEALRGQATDTHWAPNAEASLAEVFTSDDVKGLVLETSHCGESLCRLEVSAGDAEADVGAFERRFQLLSHKLPWQGQGMAIITGVDTAHPTGVVYLAREGQLLPMIKE